MDLWFDAVDRKTDRALAVEPQDVLSPRRDPTVHSDVIIIRLILLTGMHMPFEVMT